MLAQTCAVLLPNSCNPSMSVKCKTQIPSSAVQGKAAIPKIPFAQLRFPHAIPSHTLTDPSA